MDREDGVLDIIDPIVEKLIAYAPIAETMIRRTLARDIPSSSEPFHFWDFRKKSL
jgi:hypothetical protein